MLRYVAEAQRNNRVGIRKKGAPAPFSHQHITYMRIYATMTTFA